MAIRIQYQNNVTGAAFDITTLVSGAKWSTKRSGSPASLELTAIVNDEIQWSHGGIVTLLDDKTGLFYGYVVKISQNEKEQVQITAYDQTWYLKKNKDTYVFKGKRADQVLKQIAEDFKLKTGSLANTGYSIPSMIEDGQTLFDIVLKAIDYTLGIKMYGRYMDDFYLIHPDKDYLRYCLEEIKKYLVPLGLELNQKTAIFPLTQGIDFLGFRTYLTDTGKVVRKVRRESKNRIRKRIKRKCK